MDKNRLGEGANDLAERLGRHPALMSQIKGLLDEVENQSGALSSADEVEEALIGRLRKLGQTGLAHWAEREASKLAVPPAGARRGSKKVCWLSSFGPVAVWEQRWRSGSKQLRPVLSRLGVTMRGCSRRLQRVLTDFGADEAFAPAAAKVMEH